MGFWIRNLIPWAILVLPVWHLFLKSGFSILRHQPASELGSVGSAQLSSAGAAQLAQLGSVGSARLASTGLVSSTGSAQLSSAGASELTRGCSNKVFKVSLHDIFGTWVGYGILGSKSHALGNFGFAGVASFFEIRFFDSSAPAGVRARLGWLGCLGSVRLARLAWLVRLARLRSAQLG